MHHPAPVQENDTHKLLWNFDVQTDHLISRRRPDLIEIYKIKRIYKIVYFAVPADHRIKLKKCEKVTIIPIVIGDFDTVTKALLKGMEELEVGGRVETIQTAALARRVRILRKVFGTWGDLLSLKPQWKTLS